MKPHFSNLNLNSARTTKGVGSPVDGPDSGTHVPPSSCPASTFHSLADSIAGRLQGKRVGMVMFSFYPEDVRPRRAAEALVGEGMRVDLICLGERGEDPKHEILDGIDVLRLPIRRCRGSPLRYGFEYFAFLLASAAILAVRTLTRGYDLIYVHNMPDILVLSGLIPKLFGAKVILDLHDPMPELMMTIFGLRPDARGVHLLQRLEKWSIALADSVVTVNRACARLFTSRSCPSQKLSVVMNSPDERIFRLRPPRARAATTNAPSKPFVIIYHGSLVERNGLDLAVDALARVRGSVPSAELRIYGWHTPYLERVMESVRNKGLQEVVQYLGPKPLEQLVQAIEECDVGIIPNRRSIFTELNTPVRIFEYLALGKPVIAPRAAGICDYFDDASLFFFELGNADDLAEKIEYAFSHPDEAAEIARRGQEIWREHSWRKERERLLGLVAGLLGEGVTRVDSICEADAQHQMRHSQHRIWSGRVETRSDK